MIWLTLIPLLHRSATGSATTEITRVTTTETSVTTATGVTGSTTGTIFTSPSSSIPRSTLVTTSGKRKLWQDENAPKAPLSAYLQFLKKNRETFRAKNPNMGVHDVTKCLGSMWSELPSDQKQVSFQNT